MMSESYTDQPNRYDEMSEHMKERIQTLVDQYMARANLERTKFQDDSYDSDIASTWSSKEIDEAIRHYHLYMAVARDIASVLS